MATKKQKREAGRIKAEKEREDLRLSGLKAQQQDRERRTRDEERIAEEIREIDNRYRRISVFALAREALR